MAFVFKRTKDGTTPQTEVYKTSSVDITKGSIVYFYGGYMDDTTVGSANTANIAGIAEATITTSDSEIPVQVNRSAIYEVDTTDTPTQAQVGTNVTLTSVLEVNEDNEATGKTAVCKIEKLISGSSKKIEVSLNFASPTEA